MIDTRGSGTGCILWLQGLSMLHNGTAPGAQQRVPCRIMIGQQNKEHRKRCQWTARSIPTAERGICRQRGGTKATPLLLQPVLAACCGSLARSMRLELTPCCMH